MMTQTQFTLPEQSDWCDNMTVRSSFTSERVQTLFFDESAGRARKIWSVGTRLQQLAQYERWAKFYVPAKRQTPV